MEMLRPVLWALKARAQPICSRIVESDNRFLLCSQLSQGEELKPEPAGGDWLRPAGERKTPAAPARAQFLPEPGDCRGARPAPRT